MTPQELIDVLDDCDDFLDNYTDVDDGDDGRPVPNRAMTLRSRVIEARDSVQRVMEREGGDH